MLRWCLVANLLLLLTAGSAQIHAAQPPVVVHPGEALPAPARKALGQPERALSRATAWRKVREARARRRLARARKAAEAGRQAVVALRLEEAQRALREALEHFAAAQPLAEACSGAHDAARDLAFLHWQRQGLAAARRWRAAAAALTESAIDPTRYPPEFLAFWRASDGDPAAITVTVAARQGASGRSAPPAKVWINCKAVGETPAAVAVKGAALASLAAGPRTASAILDPGRGALVQLRLVATPQAPSAEDATALLKATGAPALLWVRRGADETWIVDRFTSGGGWQRPHRRIAAAPPQPRPGAGEDDEGRSVNGGGGSALVGWALTGAAVAALAAGAVTAVLADGAADEIERKAAEGELFDPADEDDNRRFRTASYATLAVGGALAAGAAVYWIWRARRRDTPPAAAGLTLRGASLVLRW